jgi:hypothetical protein
LLVWVSFAGIFCAFISRYVCADPLSPAAAPAPAGTEFTCPNDDEIDEFRTCDDNSSQSCLYSTCGGGGGLVRVCRVESDFDIQLGDANLPKENCTLYQDSAAASATLDYVHTHPCCLLSQAASSLSVSSTSETNTNTTQSSDGAVFVKCSRDVTTCMRF